MQYAYSFTNGEKSIQYIYTPNCTKNTTYYDYFNIETLITCFEKSSSPSPIFSFTLLLIYYAFSV